MEEACIMRICGFLLLLTQGGAVAESFLIAKEEFDSYMVGSIQGQGAEEGGWTGAWTGDRAQFYSSRTLTNPFAPRVGT